MVRDLLDQADFVVASELTVVECERILIRVESIGEATAAEIAERRERLHEEVVYWNRLRLEDDVLDRACRPFPEEPLRTLDALHLASALVARASAPDLSLLSLDTRIRASARGMGLAVVPK